MVLILLNIAPPLIVGIKRQYFAFLTPQTKIAEISLQTIIDNSESIMLCLRSFFKDPDIKAILMHIESPGGTPGSCQSLFNEIQYLKKRYPKPIITLTENLCVSGVYYIACATDYIIAAPSCLVGGIGARFSTFFDIKKLLEDHHIEPQTVSAGTYKTAMSPFVSLTPEQRAMLQDLANNTYEQFAHDVALSRKLSIAQKDIWGDGKLFTGQQALKIGLVDALGSYSTMLDKIQAVAPIEGEILWVRPESESTLSGWLDTFKRSLHSLFESSAAKIMLRLSLL